MVREFFNSALVYQRSWPHGISVTVLSAILFTVEIETTGTGVATPSFGTAATARAGSGYRTLPRRKRRFVWVRYQEPDGTMPFVDARAGAGKFSRQSAARLHGEATGTASPAAMQLWADLIQHYAGTFAEPWRTDDRLRTVWQQVSADLTANWSLARLARLAGLGGKQFGRLCQQSLGRTPSQHVTWLRLQRAASLLSTSDEKVESIARSVGYASLFTFSNNFKRFTGCRPSEYRRRDAR